MIDNNAKNNPMKMIQGPYGLYILPPTQCSEFRENFFRRGNQIIGFYVSISTYSEKGLQLSKVEELRSRYKDSTPIPIGGFPGRSIVINYGQLKKLFSDAGTHLTNQVFLMIYGNFEAYLIGVVQKALLEISKPNGEIEVANFLSGKKWEGKFSKLTQEFKVDLGGNRLKNKFASFEMEFLGEKYSNPIVFLDALTALRHRLVHSNGRVDGLLISQFPKLSLKKGDLVSFQLGIPIDFHLFFCHLTEVVDDLFSARFNWKQNTLKPEALT